MEEGQPNHREEFVNALADALLASLEAVEIPDDEADSDFSIISK
jgi:hypothetical protein